MKLDPNEDARKQGGVDLATIQKYLNLWYSLSLDLFGSEISTNAASFFASGLKGRAKEEKYEDHVAIEGAYPMDVWEHGAFRHEEVPLRTAMNEVLRDGYVEDCQRGVDRWNKVLADRGMSYRFTLPSRRFHRAQGILAGSSHFDVDGTPLSPAQWEAKKDGLLPSVADRAFVKSLQATAIHEPGKMANWVAAPARGINNRPLESSRGPQPETPFVVPIGPLMCPVLVWCSCGFERAARRSVRDVFGASSAR